GQPERPYDVTGWTLPLQMGVRTVEIGKAFEAKATRLAAVPRSQARIVGVKDPRSYVLLAGTNDDYRLINRLQKRRVNLGWEQVGLGEAWPAGSVTISRTAEVDKALPALLDGLSVTLKGMAADYRPERTPAPRLALYQPWAPSMDEGWTRLVLEQFEFEFKSLHNEDVRAGKLRE